MRFPTVPRTASLLILLFCVASLPLCGQNQSTAKPKPRVVVIRRKTAWR